MEPPESRRKALRYQTDLRVGCDRASFASMARDRCERLGLAALGAFATDAGHDRWFKFRDDQSGHGRSRAGRTRGSPSGAIIDSQASRQPRLVLQEDQGAQAPRARHRRARELEAHPAYPGPRWWRDRLRLTRLVSVHREGLYAGEKRPGDRPRAQKPRRSASPCHRAAGSWSASSGSHNRDWQRTDAASVMLYAKPHDFRLLAKRRHLRVCCRIAATGVPFVCLPDFRSQHWRVNSADWQRLLPRTSPVIQ